MNRNEFMKQLEALLQNISTAEREEALQYYNDYFDDAGPENEQSVIEALGNPARVAENIKRDLYGSGYGDSTYQRANSSDKAVVPYGQERESHVQESYVPATTGQSSDGSDKKLSGGMIALIVVACVVGSPLILSFASGLLGVLIGIIGTWFSLILAFGIVAIVLIIVCLVLLAVGVMCLFTEPMVGVGMMGAAMLCGGVGILFLMLTVAMAGIATPAICSGIVRLFRRCKTKK